MLIKSYRLGHVLSIGHYRLMVSKTHMKWRLHGERMKQFQRIKVSDGAWGRYILVGFWLFGIWRADLGE